MTSNDDGKNVFDLYGEGSADEATVEYKALEHADGVNSIIINTHDGKT